MFVCAARRNDNVSLFVQVKKQKDSKSALAVSSARTQQPSHTTTTTTTSTITSSSRAAAAGAGRDAMNSSSSSAELELCDKHVITSASSVTLSQIVTVYVAYYLTLVQYAYSFVRSLYQLEILRFSSIFKIYILRHF